MAWPTPARRKLLRDQERADEYKEFMARKDPETKTATIKPPPPTETAK